mmetsp:Transcript_33012/g.72698  ORF Transcript_33012/g.72698 Transcript_33012/m.72698 type:complete len:210 (+) Transcript_33012:57-686(+)
MRRCSQLTPSPLVLTQRLEVEEAEAAEANTAATSAPNRAHILLTCWGSPPLRKADRCVMWDICLRFILTTFSTTSVCWALRGQGTTSVLSPPRFEKATTPEPLSCANFSLKGDILTLRRARAGAGRTTNSNAWVGKSAAVVGAHSQKTASKSYVRACCNAESRVSSDVVRRWKNSWKVPCLESIMRWYLYPSPSSLLRLSATDACMVPR